MAHMIPNEVRASTTSAAERRLFARFGSELNDQWTVFHSLGLANHATKRWGEVDFVVVGPPGVFCLEIKGGRLRRENGMWIFTDRNGKENSKSEGPFEQAKSASFALKNYLLGEVSGLSSATFGWGVMTPDIEFAVQGPDISPQIVFDERDLAYPLSRFLRRLGNHFAEEHERVTGYEGRSLGESERRDIAKSLRGDFDLRPTLRARVKGIEDDLVELTREQQGVLQSLSENPRLMVQGGAGTGKTLLAIEEARRYASAGKRVLLVCYSRALGDHLAQAVKDFEASQNVWAGHFALFQEQLVNEAGLRSRLDVDAEEREIWDVFLPDAAFEAVIELDKVGCFDVIIVDEGQDFGVKHLAVFDALLRGGWENGHFSVFYDPFQIPFRASASRVVAGFGAGAPVRCKLTLNCRNTQQVAWATQALSEITTSEITRTNGPDPQWLWSKNEVVAREKIAACLREWLVQGMAPSDIVVLSPLRWEKSVVFECKLAVPFKPWTGDERAHSNAIRFVSVADFKGLEAKAVLLCDANDWEDEAMGVVFYVALSRSKSLLAIALDDKRRSEWLARFTAQGVKWKQENLPHP